MSQMAEGVLRKILSPSVANVASAGLQAGVNSHAKSVMHEIGIDIDAHTTKSLSTLKADQWEYVISLCGCTASLPLGWYATYEWNIYAPPLIDRGDLSGRLMKQSLSVL